MDTPKFLDDQKLHGFVIWKPKPYPMIPIIFMIKFLPGAVLLFKKPRKTIF